MSRPHESDDLRQLHSVEPTTVRLYGFKEVTLPAYLLLFLATILAVAVLIGGAQEIVEPRTSFGEKLHRLAMQEPWSVTVAEWIPTVLGIGMAFEVVECIIVLTAFARKSRHGRNSPHFASRSEDTTQ